MEELNFIKVQTNALWHLWKQEWHLSTLNTSFLHAEEQRRAHQLVPKPTHQQESGLSAGADFEVSISENTLFSVNFSLTQIIRIISGSAGAVPKGDVHGPIKDSSTLLLNVILNGNSVTSSSPCLVQPALFLFPPCML